MYIKELLTLINQEFPINIPDNLVNLPIEKCQLVFKMPLIYTPNTLYIQIDNNAIVPTKHPNCFFILLDASNNAPNAISSYHSPIELYLYISALLTDNDLYAKAISDLQKVIINNGSIEELVSVAYKYLENPIHILDDVFSLITSYPKETCGNEIFDYFLINQKPHPNYLQHVENTVINYTAYQIHFAQFIDYKQQNMKLINCSIGAIPNLLGGIEVLAINREFTQTDIRIVDFLVTLLSIELYKKRDPLDRPTTQFDQFIQDILHSNLNNQGLLKLRLRRFPQLENINMRLLVSRIPEHKTCTLKYYFDEIQRIIPYIEHFQHQGNLYFVIDNSKYNEKVFADLNRLALNVNTTMIISHVFDDILHAVVPVSLLQSSLTLVNNQYQVFQYKDLYFKTLLYNLSAEQKVPLSYFVHPGIKQLVEFDNMHQSDFLKTFKVYLQHNCSPSLTASYLHLHRNSLAYRIQKARQICGFLSEDPIECQNYLLSIQIYEYLSTNNMTI